MGLVIIVQESVQMLELYIKSLLKSQELKMQVFFIFILVTVTRISIKIQQLYRYKYKENMLNSM